MLFAPFDAATVPPTQVLVAPLPQPYIAKQIANVPFYSQFSDISSAKWKKQGCGIASLAMVIDYYSPKTISVDTLLTQGIKAGAYSEPNGWIYSGLISLSQKYGLNGSSYDLSSLGKEKAFSKFKSFAQNGPVIASVHYKFQPSNPIPHLVVVTGIDDQYVYYNDPAAKTGDQKITIAVFEAAWKNRFIVIRPQGAALALR